MSKKINQKSNRRPSLQSTVLEPMVLMSASPLELDSVHAEAEQFIDEIRDRGEFETEEEERRAGYFQGISFGPINLDKWITPGGEIRHLEGPSLELIDLNGITEPVTVDLSTSEVEFSGTSHGLEGATAVQGAGRGETFAFSDPRGGEEFIIVGANGESVLDLSQFKSTDVEIADGVLRGSVEDGEFLIYFSGIDYIEFADGTQTYEEGSTRWPERIATEIQQGTGYEPDEVGEPRFSVSDGNNNDSDAWENPPEANKSLIVNGSFEDTTDLKEVRWGHYGKSIQGWTLQENATLVAQENFEGGAEGWSNNTTTEGGEQLTEFLGRFGGSQGEQAVSKTFDLQGTHNFAVVEFDFLKLDSWDSDSSSVGAGANEAFNIFINDSEVIAFEPEGATTGGAAQRGLDGATGVSGNIRYTITSSGEDEGLFGRNPNKQWFERSYHVRLEVINPGPELKLGFGSTLNQAIADESFGVDNVTVFGADNPGTRLSQDGTFESDGNRFEIVKEHRGIEASDGDYWLDMGGSPGNLMMSQQVQGVIEGENYVLSFDLADSKHDSTDGLKVIWNGEVIAEIDSQDASMDRFEFNLVGGAGDGSNTLTFVGTGESNNFGVSLDNVELISGQIDVIELGTDAGQAIGSAGESVSLGLRISENLDPSQISVTLSGVPAGSLLSAGTLNSDGTWTVSGDELATVSMRTPTNIQGDVTLEAQVTSTGSLQNVHGTKSLTVTLAPPTDFGNFVANSSFENLSGLRKTAFGYSGDSLDAWQLEAGPRFEVHDPRAGVDAAQDGDFWLDMDASPGNVTVSQQVLGLDQGKVYNLEFSTANSHPFEHKGQLIDTTTNGLVVFWNGEKVAEVSSEDTQWTKHELNVRAGSGDGTNKLTFQGLGNEDNVGISLDQIRLTETDNLLVNGSFENTTDLTASGFGYFGKSIQGWTLTENGTLIAQETFEGGAEGWSQNETTKSGNELTEFLGQFGGSDGQQAISKTFNLPEEQNFAVVEFDFLKLDSWDSDSTSVGAGANEAFNIFINDNEVIAFEPEGATTGGAAQLGRDGISGTSGNIRYTITSAGEDNPLLGSNPNSQWFERPYHVRLEVAQPGTQLKLGFGSTLNQAIGDESFGIDNVTVFGADNPGTRLTADGRFESDGNRFEIHNPRAGVGAADGDYWLDLGGTAGNIEISQQVPNLEPGQVYQLSFSTANSDLKLDPNQAPESRNGLQVIWNGKVIDEIFDTSRAYTEHRFELTAGSNDGTDRLTLRGLGKIDNIGSSLDDVRLRRLS